MLTRTLRQTLSSQTRIAAAAAVVAALLVVSGCGGADDPRQSSGAPSVDEPSASDAPFPTSGAATLDESAPGTTTPAASTDAEPGDPDVFHCASESYRGDEHTANVAWRATLVRDDGTWSVDVWRDGSHGPLPEWAEELAEAHAPDGAEATVDAGVVWSAGGFSVAAEAAVAGLENVWTGDGVFGEDGVRAVACWQDGAAGQDPRWRYDEGSGRCLDAGGDEGRNAVPVVFARETGLAHCADFAGVLLNEDNLGYPVLAGWDLRGADLSDAVLSFADLDDAELEGADMRTFFFGYANVRGSADAHTLPPEGFAVEDGRVEWMN